MNTTVFTKYYPQFLLLILAFTFFTRMYQLHIPERYVFDEVYHAVTAKLIAQDNPWAYEWHNPPPEPNTAVDWLHPPLAKYTQALSMKVFGLNSFGWRFSSVIFGILVVFMVAKIAELLFENKQLALLAAFLTSLDGLVFAMSRIAMNDIHVTFFILLSLYFYIKYFKFDRIEKKDFVYSGIAAGLAIGTKWSGAFVIGTIGLLEGINLLQLLFTAQVKKKKKTTISKINFTQNIVAVFSRVPLIIFTLIILPALIYILSYSHMFWLGKDFNHLIEMHKNIWWYQTTLTATHPAQSKPIQWFLNTKPVWITVDYARTGLRSDIYAVGNPLLFWIGDISVVVTLISLLAVGLKSKSYIEKTEVKMLTLLIFAYIAIWLPWQLSPRIMFFYHYLPAVPLLCINLAFWINKLLSHKKLVNVGLLIILLITANFVLWYPHLAYIHVPVKLKESLYFYFDFWRQV